MKKLCPTLLLGFSLAVPALPLRAEDHPFSGMVVFGDSLSDGGNLNWLLADGFSEKTAQWLTGWDPNYYYNYRFSNGPIWVDQLNTMLGFGAIGTLRPNDGVNHMDGTNFAWAGSRSGTGTYGGIFPNLQLQIDNYATQLANGNPALPNVGTTLFTIWSGANDVFASVENNDPITPAQVADNIALAITTLYAEGGRFFVVPNLPPIGQIPSYVDDPIKGPLAAAFVDSFNALLDAQLEDLSGSFADITFFQIDVHGLFLDIMSDPAAYGFTNVTETAYVRYGLEPYEPRDPPYGEVVPNPDGYFYWDAAHGTALTNFYIADAAYQKIAAYEPVVVPEPATWVVILFIGFFVIAARAKRSRERAGEFSSQSQPVPAHEH